MRSLGVGLRTPHYEAWLARPTRSPGVVEAITENVLGRGGRPRALLESVRRDNDLILHGVSLSVGGVDPLDEEYLSSLRNLISETSPRVVSDHCCFGRVEGISGHDLWPLPLTQESLAHVVERVIRVQERLGRRIALENVSSYLGGTGDTIHEAEFLREVALRADCLLLVDVNNIVVSAHNHGFSSHDYLRRIPRDRVAYMHVAGHSIKDGYRFDDHSSLPDVEVTSLLHEAWNLYGDVPCIFEWDEGFPDLEGYLLAAREIEAKAAP